MIKENEKEILSAEYQSDFLLSTYQRSTQHGAVALLSAAVLGREIIRAQQPAGMVAWTTAGFASYNSAQLQRYHIF